MITFIGVLCNFTSKPQLHSRTVTQNTAALGGRVAGVNCGLCLIVLRVRQFRDTGLLRRRLIAIQRSNPSILPGHCCFHSPGSCHCRHFSQLPQCLDKLTHWRTLLFRDVESAYNSTFDVAAAAVVQQRYDSFRQQASVRLRVAVYIDWPVGFDNFVRRKPVCVNRWTGDVLWVIVLHETVAIDHLRINGKHQTTS